MNTLFHKLTFKAISMLCLGNFFFLFSDPHSILAEVPAYLGLKNQLLSPCPLTPNCVSSQEINTKNQIQPITFEDSLEQTKERIYRVINSMHDTRIITQKELYWHVEFTSKLLRYIDDVEFYFDVPQSQIHVRSASRRGYWDFGVNRRRVERIRSKFEEMKKLN